MVSFDVVNLFSSIDNKMGIESVKTTLLNDDITAPVECIIEALFYVWIETTQFLTTSIIYR